MGTMMRRECLDFIIPLFLLHLRLTVREWVHITTEVARTRASDREFLITDRHLRTGRIVTVLKTTNAPFQRLYWAAFTMNVRSNEQLLSYQISFFSDHTGQSCKCQGARDGPDVPGRSRA
jgi:hypothetical protein